MPTGPGQQNTEDDVIIQRVLAFLIDYLLSFALALGVSVALLFSQTITSTGVLIIVIGVLLIGYYIIPEGLWGQTPGKAVFGVIVVSSDGSPIDMRAAVIRNVLRLIDGFGNYVVGLVVMLLTDRRQRIGDIAAQTVVVKKR